MKKKTLICSLLAMLLCLSLGIGSAYALFAGKSRTDVVITAGNVDLTVSAEATELSSTLGANLPETSVTYGENRIILNQIVPGDVVKFDLRIKNNSTITVKYRTLLTAADDQGLWEKLEVTIGSSPCLGTSKVSAWATLSPQSEDIILPVTIALPIDAEDYNGKSCTISYAVEAVQGNAPVYGQPLSEGIYYDQSEQVYRIENAAGLRHFAQLANAGDNFAGKRVELLENIDMGGENWTPIASFAGEFNGNEKTISNFSIVVADGSNGGFFDVIEGGQGERVHDLTLKNVKATVGDGRFGGLANLACGNINRVTVEELEVTTTSINAWVGGSCAFVYWSRLNDCTVKNMVVNGRQGAAMIGGFAANIQQNGDRVLRSCNVEGFQVMVHSDSAAQIGGFAAQTQRGCEYPKMADCHVTGIRVTATGYLCVGGFLANPGARTTLENCSAQGSIDCTGITNGYAGGFLADLGWNDAQAGEGHWISGCTADVDITTKTATAGGFIGSATNSRDRSMPVTFENCVASGDITATETAYVGSFAGEADRGTYDHCVADGNVNGDPASADHFIGHLWQGASITIRN